MHAPICSCHKQHVLILKATLIFLQYGRKIYQGKVVALIPVKAPFGPNPIFIIDRSKVALLLMAVSVLSSTFACANNMNLVMRKPAFCICENKAADQLRGNREADQRLCFRYTDSTIPLLPQSEISSL